MKILVIQLYRIGDILQSFHVFRGLRRAYPEARLDLLSDPLVKEAGTLCPDIDRILHFPRGAIRRLLFNEKDSAQALYLAASVVDRLKAEHYDLVINLHQEDLGLRLAGALGVEKTLGRILPPSGPEQRLGAGAQRFIDGLADRRSHRRNLVDHFLDMAALPSGGKGLIRLPAAARLKAEDLLDSRLPGEGALVVVQSGTSRAFRGLPVEWIRAVQESLPEARFAWLGSAGEKAGIEAKLRDGLKGACLAGDTNLAEAAAVIARARLVLSGDTSALHSAALLGTPTVSAFFGSAQPFETGPYGDGHLCLYEPPECAPCELMDGCDEPRCKRAIRPELLARSCVAVLEGKTPPPGVWVSSLKSDGLTWARVPAPALTGATA